MAKRTYDLLTYSGYVAARSTTCLLFTSLLKAGRISDAESVLLSLWKDKVDTFDGERFFNEAETKMRVPDERMVAQVANAAVNHGLPEIAVSVMRRMEEEGVSHTRFSVSVLIKAFGRQRRADMLDSFLRRIQGDVEPDLIVFNATIDAYVRCGRLDRARGVLALLKKCGFVPNANSYNPILRGLARRRLVDEVFEVRREIEECGVDIGVYGINACLYAVVVGDTPDFERAFVLLQEARDRGGEDLKNVVVAYTTVISALARKGVYNRAEVLVENMAEMVQRRGMKRELEREVAVSVTAVISSLLTDGNFVKGWSMFRSMRSKYDVRLPADTYNAVIRGLVRRGDAVAVDTAATVFEEMMTVFGVRKTARGKGRVGEVRAGEIVMAYNCMMDGYVRSGNTTSGERLLDEMEDLGLAPTAVTFATLISGYGKEQDTVSARRVLKRMRKRGVTADVVVMNCFIGACVRSGDMQVGMRAFKEMQRVGGSLAPNLVTFSAIIAGLVGAGRTEEAWEMYEEMKGNGVKPNERLLDRMMAAFVDTTLRPSRGDVWGDEEDVMVLSAGELAFGDGKKQQRSGHVDRNAGRKDVSDETEVMLSDVGDEVCVEAGDVQVDVVAFDGVDVLPEEIRNRLQHVDGWTSTRAAVLLRDMETCRCSAVCKRRWRRAMASLWE